MSGPCTRTKYRYDAAGNMTYDGSHSYYYDAENRLIQVDGTLGTCSSATACYIYDALDRRAEKITGTTRLDYIYDRDGNVVTEWCINCGGPTAQYIRMSGNFVAEYKNSTTYFPHQDHLGSSRLLTGLNQSVVQNLDYLPFGELNSSDSGITTHKFTEDEHDSESGLEHAWFRKYSSALGRWMTPDPLGIDAADPANPQSWNRYAYVLNNPLKFVDPVGLDCVYLNDAGDAVEWVDSESDIGSCQDSGGYWANGYIPNVNGIISDQSYVQINSNNDSALIYSYINGQLGVSLATQTWTQGAFGLGEVPWSFFPSFEPSYTGHEPTLDARSSTLANELNKTGVQTLGNPCTVLGFYGASAVGGAIGYGAANAPALTSTLAEEYPSYIHRGLTWLLGSWRPLATGRVAGTIALIKAAPGMIQAGCSQVQ